jgi:hypothetical protein
MECTPQFFRHAWPTIFWTISSAAESCPSPLVADRRRALAAAGPAALASRGADGAKCKLSASELRELEAVLDAGPAASGWDEDQCWTSRGSPG